MQVKITALIWEEGARRDESGHSPACCEFLTALFAADSPTVRGTVTLEVSPEAVRAFSEEVLMSSVNIWEHENYDTPQERRAANRAAGKLREWINTYSKGEEVTQ